MLSVIDFGKADPEKEKTMIRQPKQ